LSGKEFHEDGAATANAQFARCLYVFYESRSFPEWSIENDYHCREHIVRMSMKEQCCGWLGTSSCIVWLCSLMYLTYTGVPQLSGKHDVSQAVARSAHW